jgi:excisionase family DNA binding protein
MQTDKLILSSYSINELLAPFKEMVTDCLNNQLKDLDKAPTDQIIEPDFITRKEASEILGVSLVTLNSWTKQGIIIGYRVGTRVRYKKNEIQDAIIKIKTIKIFI